MSPVEKAGFGCTLMRKRRRPQNKPLQDAEAAELRHKQWELITAGVFSLVSAICVHGTDASLRLPALPLPDLFSMHTHPVNFAILQLLLTIPVLYCGRHFFTSGFKALVHGNPNMDSLVAIGSACSLPTVW